MSHFRFRRRDPRRGVGFIILLAALVLVFWLLATAHGKSEVLAQPTGEEGFSICSGGACVWGHLGDPNIRHIPEPLSQEDKDARAQRDREWMDACHPRPVRDRYGVMRFHYSKPGCEFGSPAE